MLNDWMITGVMIVQSTLLAWVFADTNKKLEVKQLVQQQTRKVTAAFVYLSPWISLLGSLFIGATAPWPLNRSYFFVVLLSIFISLFVLLIAVERKRQDRIANALIKSAHLYSQMHKAHINTLHLLATKGLLTAQEAQSILERIKTALDEFEKD